MKEYHRKESPILSMLGFGGGGTGTALGGGAPLTPGVISATYDSNNDGYSGAYRGTATTCNGISYATLNARPPNQTQVDDVLSAWMNCKSYAGDGVNPQTYNGGVFFGRSGNSVTFTFTGFQPSQDMGIFLFTNSDRTMSFSGLVNANVSNVSYDYLYFNVNSSGGGTLQCNFNPSGDPPYIYWVGPRYDDPGYF